LKLEISCPGGLTEQRVGNLSFKYLFERKRGSAVICRITMTLPGISRKDDPQQVTAGTRLHLFHPCRRKSPSQFLLLLLNPRADPTASSTDNSNAQDSPASNRRRIHILTRQGESTSTNSVQTFPGSPKPAHLSTAQRSLIMPESIALLMTVLEEGIMYIFPHSRVRSYCIHSRYSLALGESQHFCPLESKDRLPIGPSDANHNTSYAPQNRLNNSEVRTNALIQKRLSNK
jgi:hypothetical protein